MNRRFEEVAQRLNHALFVYEQSVRKGFSPVSCNPSVLVMGNGTTTVKYTFSKGEIRRLFA